MKTTPVAMMKQRRGTLLCQWEGRRGMEMIEQERWGQGRENEGVVIIVVMERIRGRKKEIKTKYGDLLLPGSDQATGTTPVDNP